ALPISRAYPGVGVRAYPGVGAPAFPGGGGADPARLRSAHRGATRGGDPRLRLDLVRAAALPDRAAAGDGRPAVAAQPGTADRDRRRPALPVRRDGPAGRGTPGLRHRRAGGPHLRRPDAPLRAGGRATPSPDRPGPAADPVAVVAVDGPGHPVAGAVGPSTGGEPGTRGGQPRP